MRTNRAQVLVISVLLLLTAFGPVRGTVNQFTEDFKTTQYREVVAYQARWDTTAGVLKMKSLYFGGDVGS